MKNTVPPAGLADGEGAILGPILILAVIFIPILSCVSEREHDMKVNNEGHYYWSNQATSPERHWIDETDPARRGRAIPPAQ